MVATCRSLLSQGLVWPLSVAGVTKGVKGSLLTALGRSGRRGGLCLQRAVQPLQASVLLRVTRFDPFRDDPQLDPPYRQRRQTSKTYAGEGRSVVGPDGPGQSVLSKGSLQHPARQRAVGLLQPITDQQVPRCGILHRQRVYADSVLGAEPTLEVYRPDVVWVVGSCKGLIPRCRMPSSIPVSHQSCAVKDISRRARRRPPNRRLHRSKPCHQLLGSPGRALSPSRDQTLGDRVGRRIRTTMRGSGQVSESFPPIPPEPVHTLVARLAANAELPTQIHETHSPRLPSLYETDLLGFKTRLLPEQRIPPDGIAPIFSECVTHVPGLYPPQSSPARGEEVKIPLLR